MPSKIWTYNTSGDFSYDADSIVVGSYASLKKQEDLYLHYKFNEVSGTVVKDSSGFGRNGLIITQSGGPAGPEQYFWESGKLGNSLRMRQSYEYSFVKVGDVGNFQRTDSFAFSIWIKGNAAYTGMQQLIGRAFDSGHFYTQGWAVFFIPVASTLNAQLRFEFGGAWDGAKRWISTTSSIVTNLNDGNWHHLIFRYSGNSLASGVSFTVDEVLLTNTVGADTLTTSTDSTGYNMYVFAISAGTGSSSFKGNIDELKLFYRNLSIREATDYWNVGAGTEVVGYKCYGYWQCENNDLDSSGLGNDLTPVNGPTFVAGTVGQSRSFVGASTQYLTRAHPYANFERTQKFSVQCIIKATTANNPNITALFSKLGPAPIYQGWDMYKEAAAGSYKLHWRLIGNSTITHIADIWVVGTTVFDGNAHYVVATYDGSSSTTGMHIYVDGIELAKTVLYNAIAETILNTTDLHIGGATYGGPYYLTGSMDEITLCDYELSAKEVDDNYTRLMTNLKHLGPQYPTTGPTIQPTSIHSVTPLEWKTWTEVVNGGHTGLVKYNISHDGITWYWWNGSSWVSGGSVSNCNTQIEVDAHIVAFSPTANFIYRAFLFSDGVTAIELLNNGLSYSQSYSVPITSDARIKLIGLTKTILSDARIKQRLSKTTNADTWIKRHEIVTKISDAWIKVLGVERLAISNATILRSEIASILSDAQIRLPVIVVSILSDAVVKRILSKGINSDTTIDCKIHFVVKDGDGNELVDFLFRPYVGGTWEGQSSPFDYIYGAGTYTASFSASGYRTTNITVVVGSSHTEEVVLVEMLKIPEIIDMVDGQPHDSYDSNELAVTDAYQELTPDANMEYSIIYLKNLGGYPIRVLIETWANTSKTTLLAPTSSLRIKLAKVSKIKYRCITTGSTSSLRYMIANFKKRL